MALQVINPGQGASAQLQPFQMRLPQGPTLSAGNPVVDKEMNNLMAAVGAYADRQKKMRDNEDLVSAVTDLQKSAVDFQTEWKLSHFGVDARDAGSVFSGQVDATAKDILENRFKGRPELQAAFRDKAMQISLQGFTHGSSYDSQQDLAYRKQQLDGMNANYQGILATGTPAQIDAARQDIVTSMELLFPGMDHTKAISDLDKTTYMGMIQRKITDGDPAGAMAYLQAGMKGQVFGPQDVERARSIIEGNVYQMASSMADNGDVAGVQGLLAQYNGMRGQGSGVAASGDIAAVTDAYKGRVAYGMGKRDPNLGKVDCSGWVGFTLDKCGLKGYRPLNAEGQVLKAQREGRAMTEEEILNSPRAGMVVGIDTGPKQHDKGRKTGIDHVVVTYKDPQTGVLMVSESSGSKGVRTIPWDKWASYYQKQGARFFAGDISSKLTTAPSSSEAGQQAGETPSDPFSLRMQGYLKKAEDKRDALDAQKMTEDVLQQVRQYPIEERLSQAVKIVDTLPSKQRSQVIRQIEGDIKWEKTVNDAKVLDEVKALYDLVVQPSMGEKSYNDRIAAVQATQASQEAKDKVIKALEKQRDGDDNKYASSVALGEYKRWFDEQGGNPKPEEAKAKMLELNLNQKDIEKAREYAGKYQEYPISTVRKYAKQIDKNFSEDKVALVHEALMRDKDIVSGQKLSDEQIKNKVYSLMQKGRFAYDDDPWYGGPRVSYRNAPTYEGVLKGEGGKLRAEIPEGVKVDLEKTLVDELPWFKTASKEAKDIAIQKVYMWRTYGINIDLTPIEKGQLAAAIKKYNNAIGGKN